MRIECENCGEVIDSGSDICSYCSNINELHPTEEMINENECCDNCMFLELDKDIQCSVLAKIHKWDRLTLEIDSTDTFRCKGYKNA